jgi:hypothetical protein
MRPLLLAAALGLVLAPCVGAQEPAPIQDNSFLIEEAYNQEARVVQHISAFLRASDGSWWYTFTQEWPLFAQRSQLSYTVPFVSDGFGDLALNYRLQLAGPAGTLAVSPRVSLLLPTGAEQQGRGSGAPGFQVNLPASVRVAQRLVTHWNAGATLTPGARNAAGEKAATAASAAGASAIWEVRSSFNLLVEVAWSRIESVVAPDATNATEELFINPGIRWAHTFASGLQIVPGIGVPLGIGPSRRRAAVFLYLSLEHPF